MNARFLCLVAIACTLVTQPIFGQATTPTPHELLITENSSTSLSVTYDGSTTGIGVTSTLPDQWAVTFPQNIILNDSSFPGIAWFEPGTSNSFNNVTILTNPQLRSAMTIVSDAPFAGATQPLTFPDEGRVTFVGVDLNGGTINVTFDDDGDMATTVPDTGSTFGLLFLALTALFGATRFRSLRLA